MGVGLAVRLHGASAYAAIHAIRLTPAPVYSGKEKNGGQWRVQSVREEGKYLKFLLVPIHLETTFLSIPPVAFPEMEDSQKELKLADGCVRA